MYARLRIVLREPKYPRYTCDRGEPVGEPFTIARRNGESEVQARTRAFTEKTLGDGIEADGCVIVGRESGQLTLELRKL